MTQPLNVLLAEDDPIDAELILRALRRAGFEPNWKRVDTDLAYLAALHPGLDVVLCDFHMPQFNWMRALELISLSELEIPLIIVSGTIGEEAAVEAMKHGAADYLLKDRLTRLGMAVNRVILQSRLRRERAQTKQALADAEARYRGIFENAIEGIYQAAPDWGLVAANPSLARLAGYDSAEEMIAKVRDITELLYSDPERRAQLKALLAEQGAVTGFEAQMSRKDGSLIWISSNAKLVRHTIGPVHCEGTVMEITERKELETKFLRAQRLEAIGTLASGISHDLNNILTPVLIAAGLLKENMKDAQDRKMLGLIEQSAKRGSSIISQLLTFSRGIDGRRVAVQCRHLIKEMLHLIQETFPRDIKIVENTPADLWCVTADATQIHQVIMNLCVNARDAMPEGGELTLSAGNVWLTEPELVSYPQSKPGPYVVLSVVDSGQGIASENLTRIFEPFFTTKEIGKGSGLGLPTVLGIVKSHGGFVTVDSLLGKGTTFKIHLPAIVESQAGAVAEEEPPVPDGHGELILVVDDEAPIRETTKTVLESHGYRVLAASGGEDAIRIYIENNSAARLLLTDVMMPGMGGVELVRTLRILDPQIPVIATSGLGSEHKAKEFAALGVSLFLTKPYPAAVLLQTIERAFAAKS